MPVVAVLGYLGVTHQNPTRKMQITGGRTTLGFYPGILQADGLRVVWNPSAEGDNQRVEPTYGFQIDFSNLRYALREGRIDRFDGGSITHKGGFKLICGNKSISADQFLITPSGSLADGLQLVVDSPKEAYTAFNLEHAGSTYDFKNKQLTVGNLDVVLSLRSAQELGRPDLAGTTIGFLKLFGNSDPIDGGGDVEPPKDGGQTGPPPTGLDLSLSDMGGISYVGRVGTFPNGTNALTAYTTSCNVGTTNILWNPPMATTHPGIIVSLYRLLNGKFEQIGSSWVKHGFFATNASQCGACHDPGGSYLGLACSDTYGGGNNDDQFYLGGRDEWNPFTGVWTCQGSWFSNFFNDCTRRNNGSGLSVIDHRLAVKDSDLANSGAQYFYEAQYITQSDINIYNNIASRSCTMSWNGTSWNFSTTDSAEALGPAIYRYGEVRNFAMPRTDGDVIVAVQTSSLGGGMYHYDYAVYNSSSDRQVRQFSVPIPSGRTVQNIGFRDVDQNASNDWTGVYLSGAVSWSTGTEGSSSANPLKYATVYNFRFDSDVPPALGVGQLGLFKSAGSGPATLSVATKGPVNLQPNNSFSPVNGTVGSGDLSSLNAWDGNHVTINGSPGLLPGIQFNSTSTVGTASSLVVGVVASQGLSTGATSPVTKDIQLWNWSTNAWESVDTRAATTADSWTVVTITTNASRFIDPATHQVMGRVMMTALLGANTVRMNPQFDQVGIQVNP